jgi:hypothetical protein
MGKIINKIKNNKYTYELGYDLYDNKIYPSIEIYKNEDPARIQLPQHSKCRCYYVEADS